MNDNIYGIITKYRYQPIKKTVKLDWKRPVYDGKDLLAMIKYELMSIMRNIRVPYDICEKWPSHEVVSDKGYMHYNLDSEYNGYYVSDYEVSSREWKKLKNLAYDIKIGDRPVKRYDVGGLTELNKELNKIYKVTMDLNEFIDFNGGVDTRKLEARNKTIAKRCDSKYGDFLTDMFGEYGQNELKEKFTERATPEELKMMKKFDMNNVKYEFQKIIRRPTGGFYIVDFYLPFKNMIIEIDNPYKRKTRNEVSDILRTEYFKENGFKYKRIDTEDIK